MISRKTKRHRERHKLDRSGWLRAAVLGANDGILSTSSLMLGVAAASHAKGAIFIAGLSGLVAGALSMAAGEYVSVSSQADVEHSELAQEKQEIKEDPQSELAELAEIYTNRGLDQDLAKRVAEELTKRDALEAHARDELGISNELRARPVQAALASALSFSTGAALPLIIGIIVPLDWEITAIYASSLALLLLSGALGAYAGGASLWRGAFRVGFWGALAMGITAGIGAITHNYIQ